MRPGKLVGVGSDDDGAFKFTFPTDLSVFPVNLLRVSVQGEHLDRSNVNAQIGAR
jgi:hypothetical protein